MRKRKGGCVMGSDDHDWTVLRNAVKNLVAEHPMIAACVLQAIDRRQSEARAWEPAVRAAQRFVNHHGTYVDLYDAVRAIPEEHRP